MDTETTIAQGLHTVNSSDDYDAACKRVLSEKVILARIMKACLAEYRDCDVDEIASRYIEGTPEVSTIPVDPDIDQKDKQNKQNKQNKLDKPIITGMNSEDKTTKEGTVYYDIRFCALAPKSEEMVALILNVEAQSTFHLTYPLIKRGIYYCSRMISSQYGKGFTKSHYENIKKVYSIWICMDPPKVQDNGITQYRLVEECLVGNNKELVENYDLLNVLMLYVTGQNRANYDGILRMLDVLLSTKFAEEEKRRILQDDYGIQMTEALDEEVSAMCNLSRSIREEGRAEGRAEGMTSSLIASIKNLVKNMGMPIEQAMSVLEVPEDERWKYKDLIKQ